MSGATSNMHVTSAVNVNAEYSTAVRFPAWLMLSVCSAVCLTAVCSAIAPASRGSSEKFIVAVCSISLGMGMLAVLGYLFVRGLLLGSMIELGMMIIVLGFWGVGLFYIMDPDEAIAVSNGGTVVNANLYFFSWASFIVVIYLFHSFIHDSTGIDARTTPGRQARWFFLFASSLVVMAVCAQLLSSQTGCKSSSHSEKYCRRTSYGVALGTITCVACLAVTYFLFKGISSAVIELGISTLLIIMWTFGVSYLTFGDPSNSPGSAIGNLYFSTWISFILCAMVFGFSVGDFFGVQAPTTTVTTSSGEGHAGSDPHEEDF